MMAKLLWNEKLNGNFSISQLRTHEQSLFTLTHSQPRSSVFSPSYQYIGVCVHCTALHWRNAISINVTFSLIFAVACDFDCLLRLSLTVWTCTRLAQNRMFTSREIKSKFLLLFTVEFINFIFFGTFDPLSSSFRTWSRFSSLWFHRTNHFCSNTTIKLNPTNQTQQKNL